MAGINLPIVTIPIVPGTTTAGDSISIPDGAPKISQLVSAVAVLTGSATTLSVVDDASSSGQISKVSSTAVKLGDNTADGDMLVIVYIPEASAPGF